MLQVPEQGFLHQPWRFMVELRSTLQPLDGSTPEAVGCPKEAVTPWKVLFGTGSWEHLVTLWREKGAYTATGFLSGLVILQGNHSGAGC